MGHPDPFALFRARAIERIAPQRPMRVSEWLEKNLVLIDGPSAGKLWTPAGAPYLVEIADCLSDENPCNTVTVRKSQQTGASILALGWCLYIADREPANVLYGVPGLDALRTLNSQKLQPLIDAWQKRAGRAVFAPNISRSGQGSTTYEKRFGLNWLALANANSVMDLSMVTPRKGVKDELSKWSLIENDQDPESLFFGRFTSHRRMKTWKILEISTPEIDSGDESREAQGHCRIDRSFHRSDQRFWNIACPECARLFVQTMEQFRVDEDHPHRSAMACPHCDHRISEAERVVAVRVGQWIAAQEGPDRHPGFHIDAFMSLMMSYEAIADDWIAFRKTESGRKAFANLNLGLPYRYRGDAPDHEKLMDLRLPHLPRGYVPPRGLMLVASADVQMRGIYVEVLAFAPDRQSWPVEALYLDGSTEHVTGGGAGGESNAFDLLRSRILERDWPDAFGGVRKLDALGVDSGYRSNVVYAFVRRNQRLHPDTGRDVVHALDGRDGWGRPAMGAPSVKDIDLDGVRVKGGVKLWPVGTWPLKAEIYSMLRASVARRNDDSDAAGRCHFGDWLEESYFKQLTGEMLEDIVVKGRHMGRRWRPRPGFENHYLDCRVYNLALAEHLGLSSMTSDDWALIAQRRGVASSQAAPLFAAPLFAAPIAAAIEKTKTPPPDAFARLAQLNRDEV